MYKVMREIEGLYQTMEVLSGFKPICLLSFLAKMKEAVEALIDSEGVAVCILS